MKKLKANPRMFEIHKESCVIEGEATTLLHVWLAPSFYSEREKLLVLNTELIPSLIAALKKATA